MGVGMGMDGIYKWHVRTHHAGLGLRCRVDSHLAKEETEWSEC